MTPPSEPWDLAVISADESVKVLAGLLVLARTPDELLPHLLAAGCEVTFRPDSSGAEAVVKLPDGSVVHGYGPGPVYALVDAYEAGAWLAELPAELAAPGNVRAPAVASAGALPRSHATHGKLSAQAEPDRNQRPPDAQ